MELLELLVVLIVILLFWFLDNSFQGIIYAQASAAPLLVPILHILAPGTVHFLPYAPL